MSFLLPSCLAKCRIDTDINVSYLLKLRCLAIDSLFRPISCNGWLHSCKNPLI